MTPAEELELLELELALDQPELVNTPRPQKDEADAWYEDLGEGLAVSGMDTYFGIKDLFTDLSPEDRRMLEDWKTDAGESIWGGIGQGVGELAQIAIPGGGVLKGAKALSKLKGVGALGRTLAKPGVRDTVASAALGAAQLPEFDESRLGNAAGGAGSAVAGNLLTRALSKPFRGIKIEDDAREMIEEGVRLTPGQSASGGLTQAIEQVGQWKLFTGKGVQKARQNAMQDWNQMVFRAAAPPGKKVSKIGPEGVEDLKAAFDDAYSEAWKNARKPSDTGMLKLWFNTIDEGRDLNKDSQAVLEGLLKDVRDIVNQYTPQKVVGLDKKIRKRMNSAYDAKNQDLGAALKQMKQDLRNAIGNDFAEKLVGIDNQYAKYRTIVKASSGASALKQGNVFTPDDLIRASKQVGGETKAATGQSPLRKEYLLGASTVGRKEYTPLIDMRKALVMNSPDLTAGSYQPFGMGLMGMTDFQRGARAAVSPLADALRKRGVSSAAVGGAFLDDDY